MKVTLLSYTPDARELLLLTKQTRLTMSPGLLEEVKNWSEERKAKELEYMRGTIQSSWEFCDYVFLVDGVSRAFTHQFVRSRQGSYAQQSQRTVDMSGFEYITPPGIHHGDSIRTDSTKVQPEPWDEGDELYHDAMFEIDQSYQALIRKGVPPQDARGVLPTNIATNIVAKFNLRSLADMAKIRLCYRTQGEYQEVFRQMRAEVVKVHPWAEPFIRVHCAAVGTCAFPNFAECPIKGPVFNPDTGTRWDGMTEEKHDSGIGEYIELVLPITRDEQQKVWENTRFEAIPAQGKKT